MFSPRLTTQLRLTNPALTGDRILTSQLPSAPQSSSIASSLLPYHLALTEYARYKGHWKTQGYKKASLQSVGTRDLCDCREWVICINLHNSCRRCRDQKIRCSGSHPCQQCGGRGLSCHFDAQSQKVVVTRTYINKLQERLASLEGKSNPYASFEQDKEQETSKLSLDFIYIVKNIEHLIRSKRGVLCR